MKFLIWSLLLFQIALMFAQQSTVSGMVVDEKGEPLEYASAALLHPADSTLAFFGISNDDGTFVIRNVASGNYLLQQLRTISSTANYGKTMFNGGC